MVRKGLTEKVDPEESPGGRERTNHGDIKGEKILGSSIGSCKGPEVEEGVVYLYSCEEASVASRTNKGRKAVGGGV